MIFLPWKPCQFTLKCQEEHGHSVSAGLGLCRLGWWMPCTTAHSSSPAGLTEQTVSIWRVPAACGLVLEITRSSLLLLMHQRVYFPTQDMQHASCECLSDSLELDLGLVCGTWGESQGLGSCDLLRPTCLHKWRTWSTSGTSLSPLFLLKCFIQGTLEPLFSSLLAKAGQEDVQACSSWPSAAQPICLPGFSLRRLSQSRVWSFFVILMTRCHTWEAYSFC